MLQRGGRTHASNTFSVSTKPRSQPFELFEGVRELRWGTGQHAIEAEEGKEMRIVQFGIKYWLFSCGAGIALTLLLFQFTESSVVEPAANVLLWPGAGLATLTGFGGHDWQGFLLYISGNLVFYCALFLALFRFLKVGAKMSPKS